MELMIGSVCFTAGVILAKLAVEHRWKSNAYVPARLLCGKHFYKVVRIDSKESWEMMYIHDNEQSREAGRRIKMVDMEENVLIRKDVLVEVMWGICLSDNLEDVWDSVEPLVDSLGISKRTYGNDLLDKMKELDLIPDHQREE